MPLVRNTRTDKVFAVPAHYVGHEVLGKDLELISDEPIQAAPKKENKKKQWLKTEPLEQQEQPAPEVNTNEDKETEDAY